MCNLTLASPESLLARKGCCKYEYSTVVSVWLQGTLLDFDIDMYSTYLLVLCLLGRAAASRVSESGTGSRPIYIHPLEWGAYIYRYVHIYRIERQIGTWLSRGRVRCPNIEGIGGIINALVRVD